MEIYVVKPGDTIYSIAQNFGISVYRLIYENGLPNPYNLVQGQALIITYPTQEHVVKEGDTLGSIADQYGIPLVQLLQNNSFLATRNYIYPDETLVISYQTQGSIQTNGYAYDFINNDTLFQTLPYLTYLSIFNYRLGKEGSIIKFGDDSKLIQAAKRYGVTPLIMISSLSLKGEPDIALLYDFLQNDVFINNYINNLIEIIEQSGYYGVNILISGINSTNQFLFIKVWIKISEVLRSKKLLFFLTINPNIKSVNGDISYEKIDYVTTSKLVDGMVFLPYAWATNPEKPGAINSLANLTQFIEYNIKNLSPEKTMIGIPLIGYDWKLSNDPIGNQSFSLTTNSSIILALNTASIIQFDEASQTPFFTYKNIVRGVESDHIVWFTDVRTLQALNNVIRQNNISGSGIWNIMVYYQPLWSLLIAQYDVIKLLPDNL